MGCAVHALEIGQATGCHSAECSSSSRTLLHSSLFTGRGLSSSPFESRSRLFWFPTVLGPSFAPDFPRAFTSSFSSSLLSTDDSHHRGIRNEVRPQFITSPPFVRIRFVRESR